MIVHRALWRSRQVMYNPKLTREQMFLGDYAHIQPGKI